MRWPDCGGPVPRLLGRGRKTARSPPADARQIRRGGGGERSAGHDGLDALPAQERGVRGCAIDFPGRLPGALSTARLLGIRKVPQVRPLEVDVKAKPKSSAWFVNCDGNVFHFSEISGQWFYSEYENINE